MRSQRRLRSSQILSWLVDYDRAWPSIMDPAVMEAPVSELSVVVTRPEAWLRIRAASGGGIITLRQYLLYKAIDRPQSET